MGGGVGGQSASFEVGILAGYTVDAPSHLAGGAAADSGGKGHFVRCCTDAIGSAGCVVYASTYPAATATTATTAATATC